ncbi:MAG: DUF3857 domain-containing protein [bacterium]|nr:DUF3857 domain-containing protein [bacterium]
MKKLILILLLLLPAFFLSAVSLPQSDARYLEKEITYTLNADGSRQMEYRHSVRMDSQHAMRRTLGESFILYNPQYQKLDITTTRSTMRDGTVVPAPANAFIEVLPRIAHLFPHFSHLKEMVVVHTGLESGVVADFHYTLKTDAGMLPFMSAKEFITGTFPTDRFTLTLSVPKGTPLKYKVFLWDASPEIKQEGQRTLYVFKFEKLPSYFSEAYNGNKNQPYIIFSTADHWRSVFPQLEITVDVPEQLIEKVKALAKTGMDESFYFKVQELIAANIDNCRVRPELGGYAYRSLGKVYNSNYGTAIEKSYLLYTLLKHAGIYAEILALPTGERFLQEVPTSLQAGAFLVKVNSATPGFPPMYLDPVFHNQHLFPYKLEGITLYNLQQEKFETIDAGFYNANSIDISGDIAACGKTGTLYITLSGAFSPHRSLLKDCKAAILKAVKKILPVSKLEIKRISLLTSRLVKVSAKVEGAFLKEIKDVGHMIKRFNFPFLKSNIIASSQRKSPLHLGHRFAYRVNLSMKMPKESKLLFSVPPLTIKNEVGYFVTEVKKGEGVITLKMEAGVNQSVIEPKNYADFRKLAGPYFTIEPLAILEKK